MPQHEKEGGDVMGGGGREREKDAIDLSHGIGRKADCKDNFSSVKWEMLSCFSTQE